MSRWDSSKLIKTWNSWSVLRTIWYNFFLNSCSCKLTFCAIELTYEKSTYIIGSTIKHSLSFIIEANFCSRPFSANSFLHSIFKRKSVWKVVWVHVSMGACAKLWVLASYLEKSSNYYFLSDSFGDWGTWYVLTWATCLYSKIVANRHFVVNTITIVCKPSRFYSQMKLSWK